MRAAPMMLPWYGRLRLKFHFGNEEGGGPPLGGMRNRLRTQDMRKIEFVSC